MAGDRILDARRVLVLAPHPDDETLACGGTLSLLRAAGAELSIAMISDGGQIDLPAPFRRPDIVAVRKAEAKAAARRLGIPAPHFLGYPDGALDSHRAAIEDDLAGLLQSFAPDVVLAPSLTDHHPDHIATARAILNVLPRFSGVQLVLYQVYGTLRFTDLVDISAVVQDKAAAIRCHVHGLFGDPDRYVEAQLGLARFWSFYTQRSGSYEAFAALPITPPPTEASVLKWLTYG